MSERICPDCGGDLSPGLLYGPIETPAPCVTCWECGWQTPAVYRRSLAQRNVYGGHATGDCAGCGAQTRAAKANLLPAYCRPCYESRRPAPAARPGGVTVRRVV